jgi:hypothetical protein
MKYVAEIGSGFITYMPSYKKADSDIQKLIGRDAETHG